MNKVLLIIKGIMLYVNVILWLLLLIGGAETLIENAGIIPFLCFVVALAAHSFVLKTIISSRELEIISGYNLLFNDCEK